MKRNGYDAEVTIGDEAVWLTIAYLDSPTDYRQFLTRDEDRPATSERESARSRSEEETLWLLLVPVVVIILAVIALMRG